MLLAFGALAGCTEEKVVHTYGWWEDSGAIQREREAQKEPGFFEKIFKPNKKSIAGGWTILLAQFEEAEHPQHQVAAESLKKSLETRTGYQDFWVQNEGPRSVLYAGHYEAANDARAKTDLLRWKQMRTDGQLPSSGVALTPIIERDAGDTPEWNLLSARQLGDATLDIGYYDEEFGPNFREAAEKYVAALRQDSHEAYYYHGPNQSVISIGIFLKSEADVKVLDPGDVVVYSPAIEAIRSRHVFNVRSANGRVIRERSRQGVMRDQPSLLVEIPEF
jgi:hypothetical protein